MGLGSSKSLLQQCTLYSCSLNCQLKQFGEQCNYCEGLAISKEALNRSNKSTILTVHHSFIYSNKYQLYVDCTPGNPCSPNLVLYLISDVLKDSALQKFIDSLLMKMKMERICGLPDLFTMIYL